MERASSSSGSSPLARTTIRATRHSPHGSAASGFLPTVVESFRRDADGSRSADVDLVTGGRVVVEGGLPADGRMDVQYEWWNGSGWAWSAVPSSMRRTDGPGFPTFVGLGSGRLRLVDRVSWVRSEPFDVAVGRTSWMAAGINIGLNLLLIPPFGMIGAAWATAAAYGSLTVAYLLTSHRLWPFAYEVRRGLTIIALTGVALAGTYLLPLPSPDLDATWLMTVSIKGLYCFAFLAALFGSGGLQRADFTRMRQLAAGLRVTGSADAAGKVR